LQKNFLAGGGQFAEKTRLVTQVATSRTPEVRLDKQSVAVAVYPYLTNSQTVAGGFALGPELLPAATEKGHVTGLQGFLQSFVVHVAQHEHLSAIPVLDNRWNQPILKFQIHQSALPTGEKQKAR
jgi:hypothetical protein